MGESQRLQKSSKENPMIPSYLTHQPAPYATFHPGIFNVEDKTPVSAQRTCHALQGMETRLWHSLKQLGA